VLGDQPLARAAASGVAGTSRRLSVRLKAEMVGQLDLHRALQLAQQTARAGDLLLGPRAGQQIVDQLVGQQCLDVVGEFRPGRGLTARSASASLRSPYGLATRHVGAVGLLSGLVQAA
jgi:hypothetical protein